MGSTRLPGKAMTDIFGKPMLWRVIERVKKAKKIDRVVVATTDKEEDQTIIKLAEKMGVESFAGSENDVLDRYYRAAKKYGAKIIVRITSDCPLIGPEIIDRAIKSFLESKVDYLSTGRLKSTFPEGLDTEVFSFYALEKAWREAKLPSEREHVTPYIWKNPRTFKIKTIKNDRDLSYMRWTVDEEKDLNFVREIYKRLYKKNKIFRTENILNLLKKEPELMEINKGIIRNEGYFKSLREDNF